MGVEQLDQLGEVRERTGQAVDLVDHDNIDPVVPDVRQQPLQRRALGRTAGVATVVITGADQGPTTSSSWPRGGVCPKRCRCLLEQAITGMLPAGEIMKRPRS